MMPFVGGVYVRGLGDDTSEVGLSTTLVTVEACLENCCSDRGFGRYVPIPVCLLYPFTKRLGKYVV